MPGLPLQPPGDTPCTLRLGALAAAALAAAARAAFPALPSRASPSGWAKRRGSGGGTSVSLPLEISFCFPRRLTHPLPFLRKGDLFSGTGKKFFLRGGGGGWQRQGLLLLFFHLLSSPLQDRKASPTTAPASSFPSSTSLLLHLFQFRLLPSQLFHYYASLSGGSRPSQVARKPWPPLDAFLKNFGAWE